MRQLFDSMLFSDSYKFTMGQAVRNLYPDVEAKIEFFNRGRTVFPHGFADKLREQIDAMADVSLSNAEADYMLNTYNYYSNSYVDWLKKYRFNPKEVTIFQNSGNLYINIEGPWMRTIYWEVPLLKVISELYFEEIGAKPSPEYLNLARAKAKKIRETHIMMTEGGTRRAFSEQVHRDVFNILREHGGETFLGTSNMRLAMEDGTKAYGSVAHEWFMAHAALFGVDKANNFALYQWAKQYKDLRVALTDTYTTEYFLRNLSEDMASEYTAYRPDSGDPYTGGMAVIKRLWELGVSPRLGNTIILGDNLNMETAPKLQNYFQRFGGGAKTMFCIGTNFTNDVGITPLNIVFKPTAFSNPHYSNYTRGVQNVWTNVAKLSDDPGKYSGSKEAIADALKVISE